MPRHPKRVTHVPLDQRDAATVRAAILARTSDPNSKDERLESQVEACEAFIARMDWPPSPFPPFTAKLSGYLHVKRHDLDAVEELIRQRLVDVVVVLNFERLARDQIRRYAALEYARRFGVEYRFVEFKPDGKLPDTKEARGYAAIAEVFGEMSREKIRTDTARGREKRATLGLPAGGKDGPNYGFRLAQPGDPYTVWMEDETEAPVLRGMFQRVADDETANAHVLAAELNADGVHTRRGNEWTWQTVLEKLRNPIYCGRGRLNHQAVIWERKTDEETGETYDMRTVRKRLLDEPGAHLPIKERAIPVLVDPDLFDRVQLMLDKRGLQHGRLGRANSPHRADATLLHGEFVFCAHCGLLMTRGWRADRKRTRDNPVPYYRCSAKARDPSATCQAHMTPAPGVDAIVLRRLAFVLTNPKQIIALADANTQRHAQAVATAERAAVKLDSYSERLNQLTADRKRLVQKLQLSDPHNADDAEDIARYRERIAKLDKDKADTEAEMALLGPVRLRADERAEFLRELFSARDVITAPPQPGQPFKVVGLGEPYLQIGHAITLIDKQGEPIRYNRMTLAEAAALLGVAESEIDLPVGGVDWYADDVDEDVKAVLNYFDTTGTLERLENTVDTADVVYLLLMRTPHARLRQLLRDLGVVVEINRPRPKAEVVLRGPTPVEDRVTLVVGDLRIGRLSVRNGTR